MSKPIWFTELGCPAIDKGGNQPNVFVDPKSAESAAPYFSTGARDDLMQRRFLGAHFAHWDSGVAGFDASANPVSPIYGGRMVDPSAIHVWTWDARPYPAFPGRRDIWSDGGNWTRGHWLTGRLAQAPLDGLIRRLLADHGFTAVDASGADATVAGYVVANPGSARSQLEELMRLCGLTAHVDAGRLVFRSIASAGAVSSVDAFAEEDEDAPFVELRRAEESETAEEIVVGFMDPWRAYQSAATGALRTDRAFPRQDTIELPVVMEEGDARRFASSVLAMSVAGRESARFALPPTAIGIEPGDVVRIAELAGRWLVTRIETGAVKRVEARLLPNACGGGRDERRVAEPALQGHVEASRPLVFLMDLPQGRAAAPEEGARIASFSEPPLPLTVEASAGGGPFGLRLVDARQATMGELVAPLAAGREGRIDGGGRAEVRLHRGALFSITREELLGGGNLCAVRSRSGEWEVLQFGEAEEIAPMRFRLSTLVRAQGGTEDAMRAGADMGAPFVLLDAGAESVGLKTSEIGRPAEWRIAASGRALDDGAVVRQDAVLGLRAVKPLSPVHLRGVFDAEGSLSLRWVRRTRVAGDDWDGLDVPLGEEIERYRVAVSDGTGRELVRESDVASLVIGAAEQVSAFGGLPARLTARVAQFSLRHGAGTERTAVFDRPGAV